MFCALNSIASDLRGFYNGEIDCSIKIEEKTIESPDGFKEAGVSFLVSAPKKTSKHFPIEFWISNSQLEFLTKHNNPVPIANRYSDYETLNLLLRLDNQGLPADFQIIRKTRLIVSLEELLLTCKNLK